MARKPALVGDTPGRSAAVITAAAGGFLVAVAHTAQVTEAWLQAHVLGLCGVRTHWVGPLVFFRIGANVAGIKLTPGCSVGPVLGVFLTVAGAVCWLRPFPARRIAVAAALLAAVFALANQLRLLTIVLAMRQWGFQRGYDVSHVFVGSSITTVGFVLGLGIFVRLLLHRSRAAT